MLKNENTKGFLSQVVKGVVVSVLVTLVFVLVFAFILNVSNLSENIIKPVNQIIKLLSVFTGCFFAVRSDKFFAKGGLIGLLSAILSVLLFAIIAGGTSSLLAVGIDVICAFVIGGLSGVIIGKLT